MRWSPGLPIRAWDNHTPFLFQKEKIYNQKEAKKQWAQGAKLNVLTFQNSFCSLAHAFFLPEARLRSLVVILLNSLFSANGFWSHNYRFFVGNPLVWSFYRFLDDWFFRSLESSRCHLNWKIKLTVSVFINWINPTSVLAPFSVWLRTPIWIPLDFAVH